MGMFYNDTSAGEFATALEQVRGAHHPLGWLHASDRLFQMDILRRQPSGTLAELLGQAALPGDVELRALGLRRAAACSLTSSLPTSSRPAPSSTSRSEEMKIREASLTPAVLRARGLAVDVGSECAREGIDLDVAPVVEDVHVLPDLALFVQDAIAECGGFHP